MLQTVQPTLAVVVSGVDHEGLGPQFDERLNQRRQRLLGDRLQIAASSVVGEARIDRDQRLVRLSARAAAADNARRARGGACCFRAAARPFQKTSSTRGPRTFSPGCKRNLVSGIPAWASSCVPAAVNWASQLPVQPRPTRTPRPSGLSMLKNGNSSLLDIGCEPNCTTSDGTPARSSRRRVCSSFERQRRRRPNRRDRTESRRRHRPHSSRALWLPWRPRRLSPAPGRREALATETARPSPSTRKTRSNRLRREFARCCRRRPTPKTVRSAWANESRSGCWRGCPARARTSDLRSSRAF